MSRLTNIRMSMKQSKNSKFKENFTLFAIQTNYKSQIQDRFITLYFSKCENMILHLESSENDKVPVQTFFVLLYNAFATFLRSYRMKKKFYPCRTIPKLRVYYHNFCDYSLWSKFVALYFSMVGGLHLEVYCVKNVQIWSFF